MYLYQWNLDTVEAATQVEDEEDDGDQEVETTRSKAANRKQLNKSLLGLNPCPPSLRERPALDTANLKVVTCQPRAERLFPRAPVRPPSLHCVIENDQLHTSQISLTFVCPLQIIVYRKFTDDTR